MNSKKAESIKRCSITILIRILKKVGQHCSSISNSVRICLIRKRRMLQKKKNLRQFPTLNIPIINFKNLRIHCNRVRKRRTFVGGFFRKFRRPHTHMPPIRSHLHIQMSYYSFIAINALLLDIPTFVNHHYMMEFIITDRLCWRTYENSFRKSNLCGLFRHFRNRHARFSIPIMNLFENHDDSLLHVKFLLLLTRVLCIFMILDC